MDENGTNWKSLKSSTIDQPEIVEKMEYGKMVFKMAENGITLGKRNLTNVSWKTRPLLKRWKKETFEVFLENIFWVNFPSIFKPIIGPLDELQVWKKKS